MNPFLPIQHDVQEEHKIYGPDALNLHILEGSQNSNIVMYIRVLEAHKAKCPICTWPRLYPFLRKLRRLLRRAI